MAAEYSEEQLKKLQKTEKALLAELDRVCRELNISYFADCGTLLGAARHSGFIPWDDDIDVGMLRADYDRFLTEAPGLLSEVCELQHYRTDPDTPTYHAKLRRKGTVFAEAYLRNLPGPKGIFIDIFPYDRQPEEDKAAERYRRKAKLYRILFVSKSTRCATFEKSRLKKILYTAVRRLLRLLLLPVSKEKLFRLLDGHLRSGGSSSCVGFCAEERLKLEDILPLTVLPFEEMTVPVPGNWDAVLQAEYGDYRQLPPEKDRYSHAPELLDFGADAEEMP